MAYNPLDRVLTTSTTTGTGTYTIATTVTGYQDFSGMTNADTTHYFATDGTSWEVGLGTKSGSTLARTTILASSNSGSAVNWAAGTRYIGSDIPAYAIKNMLTVAVSGQTSIILPIVSTLTMADGGNMNITTSGSTVSFAMDGIKIGAVRSVSNTSATTPSDAAGTYGSLVVNNSGTQANTIATGSSSVFTANAATTASLKYGDTPSGVILLLASTSFNGATTSPYYKTGIHKGSTLLDQLPFINNSAYYTAVPGVSFSACATNDVFEIKLAQTNGTAKSTTCTDYCLAGIFLKVA